jgi:uncharacterized protein YjdB
MRSILRLARGGWLRPLLPALAIPALFSCDSPTGPPRDTVASVEVTSPSPEMAVGTTLQMAAVVKDENGAVLGGRAVTWSSVDTSIAVVGPNTGAVRALRPGHATIAASCEGRYGTVQVTVVGPPASVDITPQTASLVPGETRQFRAVVHDINGVELPGAAVTWNTSDASVVTVDANGRATAVSAGAAQVLAESNAKRNAAQVTVTPPPVAVVEVAPHDASVTVGQTVQLTATLKDAGGNVVKGRAVAWSSSAPGLLRVDQNGLATGVDTGTVTVSATSEGRVGSAAVSITPVPIASIRIILPSAGIQERGTMQLSVEARDAGGVVLTGRQVAWTSSAPTVATVSGTGLLTAVSQGDVTVTARCEDKVATVKVTVTPVPVGGISLTPDSAAVYVADSVQFRALLFDAAGHPVTGRNVAWSSSAPSVAAVGDDGTAIGKAPGRVNVVAALDGKTASARLDVVAAPVASVAINPAAATLLVADTLRLAAIARDARGRVLTGRPVAWTSAAPAVARVSAGLLTGISAGEASVTATVEGRSATITATVQNPPPALASVNPSGATAGSPALTVAVRGGGFVPSSRVLWNGAERPTTYVSGGELQATFATVDLAAAETAQVSVVNPAPGGGTSAKVAFQVRPSGKVTMGEIVSGTIALPGEVDEYTFSGKVGDEVNVFFQATGGTDEDLLLTVLSPSGSTIDDVQCDGRATSLERQSTGRLRLESTGTYTVRVKGVGTDRGPYRFQVFRIDRRPELVPAAIAIGQIVDGEQISPYGDIDEFTFAGTYGREVNVFFQGTSGTNDDFVLSLVSPTGSVVATRGSPGYATTLTGYNTGRFTLTENGTYTVQVRGNSSIDDRGTYRFQVFPIDHAPERATAAIVLGALVTGEDISPVGDVDEFTFEGTPGRALQISLLATGERSSDLGLELVGPTGVVLGTVYASSGYGVKYTPIVTLSQSGTYTVVVFGNYSDQDTGPYQFQVVPLN